MGTQEQGTQTDEDENGREGFVVIYDGFKRYAVGEITLESGVRLQDELNSDRRSHPRNFLKLSSAEFYILNPEDMRYYPTKATLKRGKRTLSTKVKSFDVVYPLSDFGDKEKAKSALKKSYLAKVDISLNKLEGDIEGEILLCKDHKETDHHDQLNSIFEFRNFVAVYKPKNKALETIILQAAGEVVQRPILISTDKIRNYEPLNGEY